MKRLLIILLSISSLLCACCNTNEGEYSTPAIAQDKVVEAKIEKILKGLTLTEKAGQMVQLEINLLLNPDESISEAKLDTIIGQYKVGSILNVLNGKANSAAYTAAAVKTIQDYSMEALGIPCIYGLDQIHGASYLTDGVFFPQEVNIAATFDPTHAINMGNAIAYETRAAMIPWVFSPVMDLGRDARWPRMWESWGEDPYLSSVMAKAMVIADQGSDPTNVPLDKVAACIKHYMAYGVPSSGKDRTPAYVSPLDLRERFFAPFKESIRAGALSVMVNSASVNGVPVHASHELLTEWLKDGLNWDGMIVTDWADVDNLVFREHIANNKVEAVALAVNAGIDMIMVPYDPKYVTFIEEAVNKGLIPMSRIDDAVRRVLRLKFRLGLFENPVWDITKYEMGRADFKEQALQAAIESEVLLKNNGILPLKKGTKILVTGPNANSSRALNGGWSYTWQGAPTEKFAESNTIYEALAAKYGTANVNLVEGVKYFENEYDGWENEQEPNIGAAVRAAYSADVIVACIGENSYCETPGNTNDINLSQNQKDLVKALAATKKPIILVLNEGRPRILGDIINHADAIVHVFVPSNYGGDALAELFAGDANFSGKMPYTYPKYINSLHTYDFKVSENVATMEGSYNYDAKTDVLWPFGYGLSYTTFEYSDLKATKEFGVDDMINISVTVKNTGKVAGKEAVLLYSSDITASIVPDNKRLRAFDKILLQPGESKVATFSLPASDLAFVGADCKWRLEEGDFKFTVAGLTVMSRCTATKVWNTQNIEK